MVRGQKEHFET